MFIFTYSVYLSDFKMMKKITTEAMLGEVGSCIAVEGYGPGIIINEEVEYYDADSCDEEVR